MGPVVEVGGDQLVAPVALFVDVDILLIIIVDAHLDYLDLLIVGGLTSEGDCAVEGLAR